MDASEALLQWVRAVLESMPDLRMIPVRIGDLGDGAAISALLFEVAPTHFRPVTPGAQVFREILTQVDALPCGLGSGLTGVRPDNQVSFFCFPAAA